MISNRGLREVIFVVIDAEKRGVFDGFGKSSSLFSYNVHRILFKDISATWHLNEEGSCVHCYRRLEEEIRC